MMLVKVLYFASAKELTGKGSETVECNEGITSIDLFKILLEKYPKLIQLSEDLSVAVNQKYVDDENKNNGVVLNNNDEFALIPPVSGG
jgi:molybdopterin converting factor subunit 1